MKYSIYIFALITFLFFQSCEDPIEVTLDEAPALVTVDAWIAENSSNWKVKLSVSQAYFDSIRVQGLDEATVTITTSLGLTYEMDPLSEMGSYGLSDDGNSFFSEPAGTTYDLEILLNGITYTATSTKFPVPEIDSIKQDLRLDDPFADEGIYCNFFANDLPGLGDTYWIKTFKNGAYLDDPNLINIAYDAAFGPGAEVDGLVFIQPIQELNNPVDENFAPIPWEVDEEIRVEIHSISNEAFFFLEVLRDELQNSNNGIFATPAANTPTNIRASDGSPVIGFFNVAAVSSLTDTIRAQ